MIIARILKALAAGIALVIIAGVTGLTFYIWPTYIADHKLAITPQVLAQLEKLQAERKFDEDIATCIQAPAAKPRGPAPRHRWTR